MTRSPSVLSQHLLTRSDLARLEIPSGSILAWLANGWLDQVGSLGDHGDPVFAVLNRDLARDLAAQLATVGKDTIVLTPARVRSVLLRAMMSSPAEMRGIGDLPTAAAGEVARPIGGDAIDPVPGALALTAEMLEHEITALVEMTRREAQLEAREMAKSDPEPGADATRGDDEASTEDVDFFDAEDLAGELDSWGPEEVPEPIRPAPPAEEPLAESARAAARDAEAVLTHRSEAAAVMVAAAATAETPTCITPEPQPLPSSAVEDTMQKPTTEDLFSTPDVEPSVAAPVSASASETARVAEPVSEQESPIALTPGPAPASTPVAPSETGPVPGDSAESTAVQTMTRVESFLGELRHVLVELANRPQSQSVDVQPLVAAVQAGFGHSAADASATNTAISSLAEQLGDFGKRVEVGVALAVRTALVRETRDAAVNARPASFVVARTERSTIALFGIGFLLLCWTAIFWFKTGNSRLALSTLIGANLIGCCLLAGRRRSS